MKQRALLAMVTTLGVAGASFAVAMSLPISGQSEPRVLQIEVQDVSEDQRDEGFWLNFRQWLGAKVIRPRAGTKFIVQSSAYASSPRQTDSTPCITAAGTIVRPGVVATNFLPLGTLLKIDGQLHIVEDRMNPRYAGRYLDIWFPTTSEALVFGRKNIEIEVVGYGVPGQELTSAQPAEVPSVLQRVQARFTALTKTLTAALLTKVNPNVNRYDVDCSDPANVTRK